MDRYFGRRKKRGRPRVREGRPVHAAALAGGIRYNTLLDRFRDDSAFRQQFDETHAEGRQRRADELAEGLFEGAGKVANAPRYTGALIFALTNLDPARGKNTQHVRQRTEAQVEHDLGDNLADILADIAGGSNATGAETARPELAATAAERQHRLTSEQRIRQAERGCDVAVVPVSKAGSA